jgi:hypothetical protein
MGQRVWSHRGLTGTVAPVTARQGTPEPSGYAYREAESRRAAEVAEFLARVRAERCPGARCDRLRVRACAEQCAPAEPPGG